METSPKAENLRLASTALGPKQLIIVVIIITRVSCETVYTYPPSAICQLLSNSIARRSTPMIRASERLGMGKGEGCAWQPPARGLSFWQVWLLLGK